MNEREFEGMSPRAFFNKLEGFSQNRQEDWLRSRFEAVIAGNAGMYKKGLREKDFLFPFERKEIKLPTKKDTEWMDRHFGKTINA